MNWLHFSRDEFKCKCGCKQNLIADSFVDKLERVRVYLDFPLPISSGYRCPAYNAKVSSTGLVGPHTTGHAADILVDRKRAFHLLSVAEAYGFTGLGILQKGNTRFIHLDDLPNSPNQPRPTVWSY